MKTHVCAAPGCKEESEHGDGWIILLEVNDPVQIKDEKTGMEIYDARMNVLVKCCSMRCASIYATGAARMEQKWKKKK